MENRKTSYLIIALTKLLKGERLSFIEGAKNSNQYFCTIKNKGIELIEVEVPNLTNRGYHLERRLNLTDENIELAQKYLERLKRKS
ncbi:MAG: hypothetical protein WC272_08695 [Sulfurimonas sp.]|jgi:hypothetical protein